jgi:hypothetical protein
VEAVRGGCLWWLFVEAIRSNSIRARQSVEIVVQTVRSNSCDAVCEGNSWR